MKKKSIEALLFLLSSLFVISCKVGLGEIVDLIAPEITVNKMVAFDANGALSDTVEDFGTAVYTKKNVTFSGKATDNVEVTKVYAEIKWNDTDYTFLKNADISGNDWTLDIEFEKEGACWVKFVACDKNENYGTKATKVVTLFVDESAPESDDWYIDRQVNGIQYKLKSLSDLKEILNEDPELSNPSNKDVAQNQEFLICASFNDAAGIKSGTTTISLYDENGNEVASNIVEDSSSTSDYAPKFKINGDDLGLQSSGKCFYQVRYSSSDIVPDANSVKNAEVTLGWFLWWPESDFPRCSITGLEEGATSLSIRTGDSLNVTVFDDDALSGTIECKFIDINPDSEGSKTETITSTTRRECNLVVKASATPQTATLKVTGQDKNGKVLNATYKVYVTDEFKPSLIFTSPENNQIPSVTGNDANISFTGIALDKVVCSFLEIIWVPDSVTADPTAKKDLAQNWFDSIDYSTKTAVTSAVELENGTGTYAGLKKWSAKLTAAGTEGVFNKYSFNFNIPLLTQDGLKSEATKDKYFYARIIRTNDIYTESELKLTGDNLAPVIEATPGNMAYVDGSQDCAIKFKGVKSSGLPMNTEKYALYKDNTKVGGYNSATGYYEYTVEKAVLEQLVSENKRLALKYYVEDLLGNSASAEYQFVIDTLPQIQNVTSSAATKCKKGDVIYINVAFSKSVTCSTTEGAVQLKLRNIVNSTTTPKITKDTTVYADYSSGSGTTTLVFKYTVQEGDTSTGLQVYNESGVGPIKGIEETVAHLGVLTTDNNLQKKRETNPITIDGVTPKVTSITISTDATADNKNNSISYLKAGRTVTATVITDKKVSVQGAPVVTVATSGAKKITLNWQKTETVGSGSKLTFTKKVTSDDEDTNTYSTCALSGLDVIKDDYDNPLSNSVVATVENFVVDTTAPNTPVFYEGAVSDNKTLKAGKFSSAITFSLSNGGSGAKLEYYDYNKKLVTDWTEYTTGTVTVSQDAVLVARATDYAGNVSDYTDQLSVMICDTFPSYTIECTNADGYNKYNNTLAFKVNFSREVFVPSDTSDSKVYINLSANTGTTPTSPKATFVGGARSVEPVTSVSFTYTVQKTDEFTLKVAKDAVVLTGFTDEYGNEWSASNKLSADYTRSGIKCDGVPPTVTAMVPAGTKTTQNSLNAYSNAKQIVLTFSEPVSAVSGNIYLRQTAGWAIPPMFTADEFNTVLSAVNNATIDTTNTYGLTGSQVLYMDGLEDAESLYGSTTGPANDRYHGTAQYAGPYKKMTNGVKNDGTPDLDVKYVLDFSLDIWDSDKAMLTKYVGNEGYTAGSVTEPRFGQTYETHATDDVLQYHHLSHSGLAKVVTPANKITTDSIRYVLEQAHYHERYMAVNSSYVTISGNTVTLNFPNDILGNSSLPLGREWELVIEEGSFMDTAGNKFGYAYSGDTLSKTTGDTVQIANSGTTQGSWGRKQTSTTSPVVLIQDGNNAAFMSAGVAAPVIRVDRYSYGLGIKQPKSIDANGVITYEKIDSTGTSAKVSNNDVMLQTGSTAPTGKVGVRIDTESKGAKIRYKTNIVTKAIGDATKSTTDGGATNYYSETSKTLPADPSGDGQTGSVIFLGGSDSYKTSCRQYIKADAFYSDSVKSDIAQEGVFQTVLNIYQPDHNLSCDRSNATNSIQNSGAGRSIVNIHGTTGLSGEPTIAPFPLRDQALGSAYMRQTYLDSDDNTKGQYYWISYEVLVDAGYSMYVFGQFGWSGTTEYGVTYYKAGWGDWAKRYGLMKVGEYNKCVGLESWPGLSSYGNDSIVPDNQTYVK